MSIVGMKDTYRPKKIGRVGLGITVPVEDEHGEVKMRDGEMVTMPKATDYFVVEEEVQELYGAEPKQLPIFFLMDKEREVFPHNLMLYAARGLLCMGDGERVHFRRHVKGKESEVLIYGQVAKWEKIERNGVADLWKSDKGYGTVEKVGNSVQCLYFECPRFKPWMCRPTGMLKFAIKGIVRQGYWQMTVHLNPMEELLGQLRHGRHFIEQYCGRATIEHAEWLLTLTGPEKKWIDTRQGRRLIDVWTPELELDPAWMTRAMEGRVKLPHLEQVTVDDVFGPAKEPEPAMDSELLDDLPYDPTGEEEQEALLF